ncbi:hypothetical protein HPB47_015910, partial [Ixodes persulcatus]
EENEQTCYADLESEITDRETAEIDDDDEPPRAPALGEVIQSLNVVRSFIIAQGQTSDIELTDSDDNTVQYDPPLVPVEDEPGSAEGSSSEEDEPQASSSGIAEPAVMRLAQTLAPGTRLFFDRYFTSPALLDKLVEKDIAGTGTVMNNRLPKGMKLSSEGQLKAIGWRTSEMWVCSDDQQIIVR